MLLRREGGFLRRGGGFLRGEVPKKWCLVRERGGGPLLQKGGVGFLRRGGGFLRSLWRSLRSSTPSRRPSLCLPNYLILQNYLNLKSEDESQESSHLQSSKSTCFLHSSKESCRSMTTQSIVIKVKPIRNFNCFGISGFKNGIKEIFRATQNRK